MRQEVYSKGKEMHNEMSGLKTIQTSLHAIMAYFVPEL